MEQISITPSQFWDTKYGQEKLTHNAEKAEYYASQGIWKLLQPQLKKKGHYLDVGCGMGAWMIFLKEKGYTVDGCDITSQTIQRLKQYDPSLKVQVASILNLPYPNQSLDGVLAIGLLEYVENQVSEALIEVNRVLKPGGLFFIEVPLRNILRILFYFPLKKLKSITNPKKDPSASVMNHFFTRQELKQFLEKNNFKIIAIAPHEMPDPKCHYGLYNDWAFLRGNKPKHLNTLGLFLKYVFNSISPWIAATGILVVAIKK